jgi:hypothetical protein
MQTQSWNFSNRNIVGKPCGFISVTLKGDGRGASAASFEAASRPPQDDGPCSANQTNAQELKMCTVSAL